MHDDDARPEDAARPEDGVDPLDRADLGPPAGPGGSAGAEDEDLQQGLSGLSRLAIGTLTLPELLVHVADLAVRAVPGAEGAGITVLQGGRHDTVVCSDEFVREVDDEQYGLGQGPCIDAAATGRVQRSGSLGGDATWPRFGPRASRLGVHSAMSFPLPGPDGPIGAMNLYARARHAFDDRSGELGAVFADAAAVSVRNYRDLADAQRLATQLQQALRSRATVDHAIGIVMSRTGATAEEAFGRLREISQAENRKLTDVAAGLVADAVRRARNRHTRDDPT